MAMVFGISTDELVFQNVPGPAAHKLDAGRRKRFEKIAQLCDRERDAVLILMDPLIARQTLRAIIKD